MEDRRSILDWRLLVVGTLSLLGLVAGLVALAWHGMGKVPADAARLWALVATVLLPVALWIGYRLGHTEARGRMRGIDDGLEKVVSAAAKAIELRVQAIRQTREASREQPSLVVLPPPEPSFRMLEEPQGQEIIELE